MTFAWLKRFMPRGLYGRAALILILPMVTLQIVVSVAFIQRHFDNVTERLTGDTAADILYALDQGDAAREVGAALGLTLRPVSRSAVPASDRMRWFDLTGPVVLRELRDRLPGLEVVDLPDQREVRLYLRADGRLWEVAADRGGFSASNPHQMLVIVVVFGALMTLIAFAYMRNQLRPIARLGRAADAFGRGRVMPYTPGGAVEVRAAGHAFLEMRERIERQIEQRTMMLSGVSHDLRTPLTRLKLGLSMLDDEDRLPLERDVQDMQRLIDAFLDFARGDSESGQVRRTDPAEVLHAVADHAERIGASLEFGPLDETGLVAMRPLGVQRALDNLVSNALRHGTRCRVSLLAGPGTLCFRVEDDGPGIPEDRRDMAMRPFVRLDPARNQNSGPGVGLGLAIAADVARAHGGHLQLERSGTLGGLQADLVIAR